MAESGGWQFLKDMMVWSPDDTRDEDDTVIVARDGNKFRGYILQDDNIRGSVVRVPIGDAHSNWRDTKYEVEMLMDFICCYTMAPNGSCDGDCALEYINDISKTIGVPFDEAARIVLYTNDAIPNINPIVDNAVRNIRLSGDKDALMDWFEFVKVGGRMSVQDYHSPQSSMHISQDMPDGGDCFVQAFRNQQDDNTLLVCHGIVHGQGPLEGYVFPHAWNETEYGTVIDTSNGHDVELPIAVYYGIGNIDELTVHDYTYMQVLEEVVRTGTYGPWCDELDFDYRLASKTADAIGNCFETAWDMQADSLLDEDGELLICHGILTGHGNMEGTEFTHGWNETQDGLIAIDQSNGNDLVMPVWQYYEVMGVQPDTVYRYDHDEAYAKAQQYMRYGTWEPELDFISRPIAY